MKTIRDVLQRFRNVLHNLYPITEIVSITELVLSDVTGKSKVQLKAFTDDVITESQAVLLHNILRRLETGEPVQYILGHTEFYGLTFKVNPMVLIPRPETEELIEWVLQTIELKYLPKVILDIGTGSGCIPITIKRNLPNTQVSGLDFSIGALEMAKINALLNDVEVDFFEMDILNESLYEVNNTKYSIIISNPPYVTDHEKMQMHTNVLDFEPHTALFVPDDDPLVFYRAITKFSLKNLRNSGLLFLEINENLGDQTVELLLHNNFIDIELKKDMNGKNRMIKATFKY